MTEAGGSGLFNCMIPPAELLILAEQVAHESLQAEDLRLKPSHTVYQLDGSGARKRLGPRKNAWFCA
jgi:hypothetical protein